MLARQLLLERSPAPLPRALERVAGIQAQYAPSMYVGLWSRLRGLRARDAHRALERRSVVQGTLMRMTIHLVSRRDYWPLALGVRGRRRASWLRTARDAPPEAEMAAAASALRERLADGTTTARISRRCWAGRGPAASGCGSTSCAPRRPGRGSGGAPTSTPPPRPGSASRSTRTRKRRWTTSCGATSRGFGPATAEDVASFTGLPIGTVRRLLARIELRAADAPTARSWSISRARHCPIPTRPAPPRFLPTWDATLLVHARRAGILPEELRPRVFSIQTPQSVPTFLVDGAVAGAWRFEDGAIRLEPWRRLDRADERALADEAERLAAFHA